MSIVLQQHHYETKFSSNIEQNPNKNYARLHSVLNRKRKRKENFIHQNINLLLQNIVLLLRDKKISFIRISIYFYRISYYFYVIKKSICKLLHCII